ncbi:MAG: prepilin-type N-terminal cleavage/methylation domain-containing protein [Deltaproteobacteria bacterium]|nr:MAG: prepilin-type N-terminal cleavage/methylation domain-containing protein [Deltaproteobacteria bacterium]
MNALHPSTLRDHLRRAERRGRRGMNLIEIMIVIAIIVVLISVLSVAAFQAYEGFKVTQTRLKINQLGQIIMQESMLVGTKPPSNLKEIEGVKEDMLVDGWGRPFEYVVPGPNNLPFEIVSYGRDGTQGGTGRDADIKYSEIR